MSRDFSPQDIDERSAPGDQRSLPSDACELARSPAVGSSLLPSRHPDRLGQEKRRQIHFTAGRRVSYDRDRGCSLSEFQIHTIVELGKFRAVAAHDLARHASLGGREPAPKETEKLMRLGLVRKGLFNGPEDMPRELLTLTRLGHELLRASDLVSQDQTTYHGFGKAGEANHDADLYRLYQQEASRIERAGGHDLRVVLDYELKSKVNRDIAALGAAAKREIAERHGLRVVRQKIPIPDLRIEYETPDGEIARVDLELVTEHYRGSDIVDKARAGFLLYTPRGEADHLRRVLDQHEMTADIFSL